MPNEELIKKKINKVGVYVDELRPILELEPNNILGDYAVHIDDFMKRK